MTNNLQEALKLMTIERNQIKELSLQKTKLIKHLESGLNDLKETIKDLNVKIERLR